jgi:PAS domain-containing protein
LRDREERLRAALWASRTGTYRWDIRADILDWDDNLHWLFGLPEGTTVSRVEEFVELIYSDDREAVGLAVERSLQSGVDFDKEFRVIEFDGNPRWIFDKGKTIFDERGNPL